MYTEKSIGLKSDFYTRYGETRGELYFEKTSIPCTLLDAGSHKLIFSLDCAVRAYGRGYGDVLKIMDTDANVYDIHFVEKGKGAQILYRTDIPDISGAKAAVCYTVNKLLTKMGSTGRISAEYGDVAISDNYAPKGWCAVKRFSEIKSVPFPFSDYNVLLIRTGKNRVSADEESLKCFCAGERDRIKIASQALKECRTDIFFDTVNESQKSAERLNLLSDKQKDIAHLTYGVDGIDATRSCECGVISFCKKRETDSAISRIRTECYNYMGCSVRISVVK